MGTLSVRHAPTVQGTVSGSIWQLTPESVAIHGGARILGDWIVPGTPSVRLNGRPQFGGVVDAAGRAEPSSYTVSINGGAAVGRLVRRVDPSALETVAPPESVKGTRSVIVNGSTQSVGSWATIRDVTLNGGAGALAVPPGSYGTIILNAGAVLELGSAGAQVAETYGFERLIVNSGSQVRVQGPMNVVLGSGAALNGTLGSADHPEWLDLALAAGGLTLSGGSQVHGYVSAPSGHVILNGRSQLVGGLACDRLTVNGGAFLQLLELRPTADDLSVQVDEDSSRLIALSGSDPRGATVAFSIIDPPRHGLLTGEGAARTYVPHANYNGNDRFTYVSIAGGRTSNAAVVAIDVLPVPDPMVVTAEVDMAEQSPTVGLAISITVQALSIDSPIARVRWFDGESLIGERTDPPYVLEWIPQAPGLATIRVEVTDELGGTSVSDEQQISILPRLPYATGFEDAEGFLAGPLAGQRGWSAHGAAEIVSTDPLSGEAALRLGGHESISDATLVVSDVDQGPVVFIDFFARLPAGTEAASSIVFDGQAAVLASVADGAATARLAYLEGSVSGQGAWRLTDVTFAVTANEPTSSWHRLTLRKDYAAREWDLYIDGRLRVAGIAVQDNTLERLDRLALVGVAGQVTYFDDVYAGAENPLFGDEDHDGIEDAFERARGLDTTVNDRHADADGDGLRNVDEYRLGTNPRQSDSDDDGLADNDEVLHGTDPVAPDTDHDGIPDGWEIEFGLDPLADVDGPSDLDGDGRTSVDEWRAGSDPGDYFNGVLPEVQSLGSEDDALGADGSLAVRVTDAAGVPLVNAPVTFSVDTGDHRLAESPEGIGQLEITVRSDAAGIARAFVVGGTAP